MNRLFALLLLFLPLSVHATTTITGHITDLSGSAATSSFVRFTLRGCGGNQPTVNGTAIFAPTQGSVWYKDFPANATGDISGTIYSTRDVTGNLGGDITCGSSTTAVWYGMTVWQAGKSGPEVAVHAKNTATLNVTSVIPLSTTPVVTAPSGDTTYLRIDTSNSPLTGNLTSTGTISDAGGTHSGPEIFNATDTFNSTVLSYGDNTFTGSNIFTNWNGLYIANDTKYPTVASMQTAMGSTNPAFGWIPNSPVYTGTDCPAAQTNTVFLDWRQGGRVGAGTSTFNCTQNIIQINPKTVGLTDTMIRPEMNRTSVDAAGAITSLYALTHLTNATVTGGVVDGVSTEAQVNGTYSGTLSALTGNETVATLTSTGGTVSVASGALGYCFSTVGSTTNLTECRGLWGRGGSGASGLLGARPTNSFGLYGSEQLGIATGKNYSIAGEGQMLAKYSSNQAKVGWDFEDSGGTARPVLFGNSSNNLILQGLGATGIFLEDSSGNNLLQVSPGTVAILGATTSFFPASVNAVDIGADSNPFRKLKIGTAATNNFVFTPPATAGSRIINWTDPLGTANLPFTNNTSTTTTQVMHATATAGLYTTSAIATADIATALTAPGPIGGTTPGTGAFTTLSSTGNFTPSQTNGIVGTTTNNNANAGSVGEYVQSVVATGSSVALTTNVTANVTSISLTAGDWDVTGAVDFTFGATTSYTNLIGSVSSTSATIGGQDSKFDFETPAAVPTAGADATFSVPVVRFSLSGTTTVFLVAQGTFTVSTLKAYGTIRARRIR